MRAPRRRSRRRIRLISKIFSAILLAAVSSCASQIPRSDLRFWAGDSGAQGVTRSQENQTLSCADPGFDLGLWISYADFRSFIETYVLSCKEWDSDGPMISREDWKRLIEKFLGPKI